jgi:CheY-like chemotaxis protein
MKACMRPIETKPTTVMIVEDIPGVLLVLQEKFKREQYRVFVAHDGYEGVECARKHNPDIIISDILMPGMDGVEMLKRIREVEFLKETPVVFLSILSEQEYRYQLKDMNHVLLFLWKNEMSLDDIVYKVREVLSK